MGVGGSWKTCRKIIVVRASGVGAALAGVGWIPEDVHHRRGTGADDVGRNVLDI